MKDVGNICVEGQVPYEHGAENDTDGVNSLLFIISESLKFRNLIEKTSLDTQRFSHNLP